MEVARPAVDGYLLDLLQTRTFCRRDFAETPRGVCRVNPPPSHELAETLPPTSVPAASRRAETNITRRRQAREWDEQHGKLVDLSAFQRDVLPLIQDVPLSRLQQATGLSLRYVSLIRRGERTPHPRHWQALIKAAEG
jgi:hypothetical protein